MDATILEAPAVVAITEERSRSSREGVGRGVEGGKQARKSWLGQN